MALQKLKNPIVHLAVLLGVVDDWRICKTRSPEV